jgi:DNA-binding NtrC family response regulator
LVYRKSLDEIEKLAIKYLLEHNYWNVEKVAEILKQTPRNVYRKMKIYNISREDRW